MNENKHRVPLNEERLDAVSGGANTVEVPAWAQDHVNRRNTCPECKKKGVSGIRGRVIVFDIRTDTEEEKDGSVMYECPAGHNWYHNFRWEAYDPR